jgi:hypothetical protein
MKQQTDGIRNVLTQIYAAGLVASRDNQLNESLPVAYPRSFVETQFRATDSVAVPVFDCRNEENRSMLEIIDV